MTLAGRTVLITGAKRIGAALAVEMASRGADVAVSYFQSHEQAAQTVADVRARGQRALAVKADLRCPHASRDAVEQVAAAFGRLDVLIAMASLYAPAPFDTVTDQDWAQHLAVDLSASWFCAHAAVPHMRKQAGGRIILFADTEAASGRPRHKGYLPYFVAKSGVIALGRALALELAADRVLVNTVALGPILPADGTSDEDVQATAASTPVGCWGSVSDVAKTVIQLIDNDYTTGELIRVDGGRHLL